MDWQLGAALVLVAAAGAYLARRGWKAWRAARRGCGGGCGCAKGANPRAGGKGVLIENLGLRRRE